MGIRMDIIWILGESVRRWIDIQRIGLRYGFRI